MTDSASTAPGDAPASPAAFAVIYRWRLHPGSEDGFVAAWTRISALLREQRGSLGSRLHRSGDGLWVSYAQWPSAQARESAFALGPVDEEAARVMAASIAEALPEIPLSPLVDLMLPLPSPRSPGHDGDTAT